MKPPRHLSGAPGETLSLCSASCSPDAFAASTRVLDPCQFVKVCAPTVLIASTTLLTASLDPGWLMMNRVCSILPSWGTTVTPARWFAGVAELMRISVADGQRGRTELDSWNGRSWALSSALVVIFKSRT